MNKKMHAITLGIIFPTLLLGSACSSARYIVKSDPPGASVYFDDKLVGKTPLEIDTKKLPNSENIDIRVEKENYGKFQGIIPGTGMANLGQEIFVHIRKQENTTELADRQIAEIMEAHQLALNSQYAPAIQAVDRVIAESPELAAAQLLKASILFLSQNYKAALDQYQKVLELDPTSNEALKMVKFIQDKHLQ
jgi:tetratricopeptide (TPR) repeat protein